MDKTSKVGYKHYIFLSVIMLAFVIAKIIVNNPDSDAFFLINTGRYIVENKTVPTTNVWVWHNNYSTIVQQWLCDVVNYLWYSRLGILGLCIYTSIIVTITNIVMYKFASIFTKSKETKIAALLLSNLVLSWFMNTRPAIISFTCVLIELMILHMFRQSRKSKKDFIKMLIALAVESVFLINYHSSLWWMMLVFLLPYIVPAVWNKSSFKIVNLKKSLYYIADAIVILLTSLINPNGIYGPLYLILSYGSANSIYIQELQSAPMLGVFGLTTITVIVFTVIYIMQNKSSIDKEIIYILLGTCTLSVMHIRSYIYLIIPILILVCKLFEKYLDNSFNIKTYKLNSVLIGIAYSLTAFLAIIFIAYTSSLNGKASDVCKVDDAIEYLDKYNKDDLKIYNELNFGAYMEMHDYKVYIDARPELFNEKINKQFNLLAEYNGVISGTADYQGFLDKYNFTHLVITTNGGLDIYLRQGTQYNKILSTEVYTLYEKSDFQ